MTKKLQPYLYLLIFFGAIFIIFRFSSTFIDGTPGHPESFVSYQIENNTLTVETSKGFYEITFLNNDIAGVNFYNDSTPNIDSSFAVILLANGRPISFNETSKYLSFSRNDFEVSINKSPFGINFIKANDTILTERFGFFDHDTLKGFRFNLGNDEKIYGAGFRTTPTNRRGQRFELYNQAHYGYSIDAPNLNFSVPFVISSNKYGLLFDNAQKGFLDIDSTQQGVMEFNSIGGKMGYCVVAGNNYDSIMNQYANLTGHQPMPPRWALGNIQSKFGYESQKEAEEIVDGMIESGYPLDALIIDLYWFGEGVQDSFYMGNLEWYKKNWPEPEKMISNFKKKGVKTILITEPFVLPESRYFDTLSDAGMLGKNADGSTHILQKFWFGKGGLFDIFQPRMQDWFWKKYKAQTEIGVAGWWGDLGEPETHPDDMYHVIGAAQQVHNIYAHYWHKMLWQKYAEEYPDVRLFNLNRSGFAGSQRYAIFPWSGDVSRSWQGLQAQPTAVLGMTLSGFSYMHSDLGGFAGGEKDVELYLRWLQYGVFNPVFRVHGDPKAPVEPIFYSEKTQKILKECINLRYQLLPYNYTLAWRNATSGTPLTRPLFFEEPGNEKISGTDDTYLWGPNLLVAPILEKEQVSREIYLPKGNWFDFFTDEKYEGGRWIEKPVTLENIPVFARAGSFIPKIEPIQNTGEYSSENLILHYYFDEGSMESEFTMYEDDGVTKDAFALGKFELLNFKARNFDNLLLFSFNREISGAYPNMPESRTMTLIIHGFSNNPGNISVDGVAVTIFKTRKGYEKASVNAAFFDTQKSILKIRLGWKENPLKIQIEN